MHHRTRARTMSLARVVLFSGRPVDLATLRLSSTYGGVPEDWPGYPCKPVNDRVIEGLLSTAARMSPAPVHLVPPPRVYPDQYPGAFGPVEILPSVACVGSFRSSALDPNHDPLQYRSGLTVVWFQPTTRVPCECDAEGALREVDWEGLARDCEL
ncbi:hypothetical protein ACIBW9_12970 [Streptomyces sp. NPDC049541]|uniref:hypothetical protein n=1 Tax=Streptomyces sp. NPDC049541 TaxID=3365594 RepID=UPI0037AE4AE3